MIHPVIINAAIQIGVLMTFHAFLTLQERKERYELKCRLREKRLREKKNGSV